MKDGKLEPTPSEPKSPCAFNKIIDSLGDVHGDKRKGPGCIALIWHRSLGTRHPHWVVIESYDSKKNSFRVLDPSPAGRPDRPLRYDSFPHYAVKKGNLPYHCDCLVWRDSNNEQQAASKHWIHEDRLEELMDEAAARCGGLRYLVVRNTNVTEDESKSAYDNAKDPLLDEDKPEPTLAESLRKAEFGEKLQDIYDKLSPLLKQ